MKIFFMGMLFFSIFSASFINAQDKCYEINLPKLEIINKQFDAAMRNAVSAAKNCRYYSDDLAFALTHNENDSLIFFRLNMDPYKECVLVNNRYYGVPSGYYIYNNHLFVAFGRIIPGIFKVSKNKKKFIINKPFELYFIYDYMYWFYTYEKNRFTLVQTVGECKKRK
jgi:hypothetical protein